MKLILNATTTQNFINHFTSTLNDDTKVYSTKQTINHLESLKLSISEDCPKDGDDATFILFENTPFYPFNITYGRNDFNFSIHTKIETFFYNQSKNDIGVSAWIDYADTVFELTNDGLKCIKDFYHDKLSKLVFDGILFYHNNHWKVIDGQELFLEHDGTMLNIDSINVKDNQYTVKCFNILSEFPITNDNLYIKQLTKI